MSTRIGIVTPGSIIYLNSQKQILLRHPSFFVVHKIDSTTYDQDNYPSLVDTFKVIDIKYDFLYHSIIFILEQFGKMYLYEYAVHFNNHVTVVTSMPLKDAETDWRDDYQKWINEGRR